MVNFLLNFFPELFFLITEKSTEIPTIISDWDVRTALTNMLEIIFYQNVLLNIVVSNNLQFSILSRAKEYICFTMISAFFLSVINYWDSKDLQVIKHKVLSTYVSVI